MLTCKRKADKWDLSTKVPLTKYFYYKGENNFATKKRLITP